MTLIEERSPSRATPGPGRPAGPQGPKGPEGPAVFWAFVAAIGSAFAILVAAIAAVAAVSLSDRDSAGGGAATSGSGETKTVAVALSEFKVEPASIEVAAGSELILQVTNNGTMPHDLKLDGQTGTDMIDPGGTATAKLGVMEESAQAWCTVPGHKEAGMVLDIKVTGAAPSDNGGGGDTAAGADTAATIDFQAEPAAGWQPYDPTLQPAPGGVEHQVTLHAGETEIEVAPGVTQTMWTFEDSVPGPTLRGRIGDLFTITLVNDGQMDHSIDFHASEVAWNDEMRSIGPGEQLVYQFKAEHSGIFMYHCGTAPALHHIGNGMYGALVVDPPDLAPVDHEYLFVQSELYLGPQGQPGDLTKMQDADWDAVVFNGYVNQYSHAPIRVEPGQTIRAWVLDAGPSENSSFHIVGTVFDTVYKEGGYLLRPGPNQGGSQALDLQPAQGGFVEFTLAENGLYPIVTHKFANVGQGALGLFQAGEVVQTGAAAH
jgi:nitrite reductase (NO-forming)